MTQKRKPYRNNKILNLAKNQSCTLRTVYCNHNPETVVFCHFNESWAGKGLGQKADDCAGFYGCSACHYVYDMGQASEIDVIIAYQFTLKRLFAAGLLPPVKLTTISIRELYERVRGSLNKC